MAGDVGTTRWLALVPSFPVHLTSQDSTHDVSINAQRVDYRLLLVPLFVSTLYSCDCCCLRIIEHTLKPDYVTNMEYYQIIIIIIKYYNYNYNYNYMVLDGITAITAIMV